MHAELFRAEIRYKTRTTQLVFDDYYLYGFRTFQVQGRRVGRALQFDSRARSASILRAELCLVIVTLVNEHFHVVWRGGSIIGRQPRFLLHDATNV